MGFFSWITTDTNESISNKHSCHGPLHVFMHTPDGKVYEEEDYNGYGVFGGKDYHIALAEANLERLPETPSTVSKDDLRSMGIDLSFSKDIKGIKYPIFTEGSVYNGDYLKECESCPSQGYFYYDDESSSQSDGSQSDVEEKEEEEEDRPVKKTKISDEVAADE